MLSCLVGIVHGLNPTGVWPVHTVRWPVQAAPSVKMQVDAVNEPSNALCDGILSERRVRHLFAWISRAFAGDQRYEDLGLGLALVFGDLWNEEDLLLDEMRFLLDEACAALPTAEDEPCGAPLPTWERVQASLGAMGAAQWTGRYRTRPHALLDVREMSNVEDWVRELPRGARRTLAKATNSDAAFSVDVRPIRGGEPAPHSSFAHFRVVVDHEVRLLATNSDDLIEAVAAAVSRYMWTTRQAGVVREYRDPASGRVIAFAHEVSKGRTIRGQWFYADATAARRYVWFHAMHDMVCRAVNDPTIDVVDLGPSGSDAFSELKGRYGFVPVADWSRVADYSGPFRFGEAARPADKLVGWLTGVLY